MQKLLASAAAIALALAAGAASAAQFMGTVVEADKTRQEITVSSPGPDQDMIFTVNENSIVGASLDDLEKGDEVRVFYAQSSDDGTAPVNALQVDKMAQAEGSIEGIDESAGTMTVDGQQYAYLPSAIVGVPPSELQEGDQVAVVYIVGPNGQADAVEIVKVN